MRIYGNGAVPSCHHEEDGCHKQGDHLTSAAPQLRGVKMLLETLYRSSLNMETITFFERTGDDFTVAGEAESENTGSVSEREGGRRGDILSLSLKWRSLSGAPEQQMECLGLRERGNWQKLIRSGLTGESL